MSGSPIVHPETSPDSPFVFDSWTWREPSKGEHFRRCSFCGSIHPEDLVNEQGWVPEWADRKYGYPHKFYVNLSNRDPERLFHVSTLYGEKGEVEKGYISSSDLSPRQVEAVKETGYEPEEGKFYRFGTRTTHFAKFYTDHYMDPDLSAATTEEIMRRSGIKFSLSPEGKLSWEAFRDRGEK